MFLSMIRRWSTGRLITHLIPITIIGILHIPTRIITTLIITLIIHVGGPTVILGFHLA